MLRYKGSHLRKGRFSELGRAYLITATSHGRKPLFGDWRLGRCVCHALKAEHDNGAVTSLAWVVMPDHLHWLLTLERGALAGVVCRVKARSALAINQALGRTGPVWQKGYHDRALRREEDLRVAARYIIANPVRANLVTSVGQYPLWDAIWL